VAIGLVYMLDFITGIALTVHNYDEVEADAKGKRK
jgi:hypothetical protein